MRWILRIVVILMAVVAAVIGALLLMPGDKIASLAADQIRAQTGRDVQFDGEVKITLWPVLGVETGSVTLGNAGWASDAPMLRADSLSIGLAAAPLLSGEVHIQRVIAVNPVLRLEESQGRGNWDFGAPRSLAAPSGAASGDETDLGVTLDRLQFDNARLLYIADGQVALDFSGVDLSARWPAPAAPLALQARLPREADAVEVEMRLLDLPGFAAGRVTDMEMTLTAPDTLIHYAGQVSSAGELSGQASLSAKDTARMLAAFGQPGVQLPKGLGQAAEVTAQVTYTQDGRLSLRGLNAQLDQNLFRGDADVTVADPPHVTARLTAGNLDLTGLTATSGEGGGSANTSSKIGEGWSKAPIDASALALANGSVALTANSIKTSYLTLGESRLSVALDRKRAVLKMQPVTLFSGQLTGELVANNRNGLSVGGNLQADGIELQQALTTLAGVERLSGAASANVKFLGVGQSEDQIMRSLSGEGGLRMGRGVISGIDLDRLMGSGQGGGGTTVFNSLTASFAMDEGNLNNSDLLMLLDNFKADGAGRIGLGARDLDYLLTPVALRVNGGRGLAVPVRIVGPWADPSIQPDLSQALEAAADVELDEIEGQAKDKALQKLSEELDTTVTEDQDIEELIKDRLENEATKGLLKLFGAD